MKVEWRVGILNSLGVIQNLEVQKVQFDSAFDSVNNKYGYYLFASIKQFDTHVYFDLYDYIVIRNPASAAFDYNSNMVSKSLIKSNIVLPKEVFLFLVLKRLFLRDRGLVKDTNIRWFIGDIRKLWIPSNNYIAGLTKKEIRRIKTQYDVIFLVRAIDQEFVTCDMKLRGCFHYDIYNLKITKALFEKIAQELNAVTNYSNVYSEMDYKVQDLRYKVKKPLFQRHYTDIENCFDIIVKSPTKLTYTNIFKILAPTIEGLLVDYFNLNNIKVSTKNLGTIIGGIKNRNYFNNELVELLEMILNPLRNFSLHGLIPSDKVAQFVVLVILDFYLELYKTMYKT